MQHAWTKKATLRLRIPFYREITLRNRFISSSIPWRWKHNTYSKPVTRRYIPEGNLQLRHTEDLKDCSYELVADPAPWRYYPHRNTYSIQCWLHAHNTEARYITGRDEVINVLCSGSKHKACMATFCLRDITTLSLFESHLRRETKIDSCGNYVRPCVAW